MADIRKQVTGYHNLWDSNKGYTSYLFRAGKVLQSKEVNEIQDMLQSQIKSVGDTVLTNGDKIEGCQLVVDSSKKSVTLTKGRIYLNGGVRSVSDTTVTITGEGVEVIGALLKQEVVTPSEDSSLLDTSTGYDNYNQDGAYRLKESVEIVVNNPNASILYNLIDGELTSVNTAEDLTQLDKIQATLARRTFDESGNYKVNGLKLSEKGNSDSDYIFLSIDSGKAYVKGFEVYKPAATTVKLRKPKETREIQNEPKVYRSETLEYPLNNENVKSITKALAIIQVTKQIARGSIVGGIDYLPDNPVVEVKSVSQSGKVYKNGTDYQLTNDGIDWSLGGEAPNPGTSYDVTWSYNKVLVKGTDFSLQTSGDSGKIKFESGDKPVGGSTFLVNYEFTLCRRDTISVDKDGKIIVTEGQPDILRTVESPSVDDTELLVLGSVLLKPSTTSLSIINNNTQNISMLDLYKMLKRIDALEYNQAITDLDKEAIDGEPATQLIGVLTDGFIGLSKADTTHSQWDAAIDFNSQELTLPFSTVINKLEPDMEAGFRGHLFKRMLTAPFTEMVMLGQTLATGTLRVNSYSAFPKSPSVKISPEVDNWIEEQTIVIDGSTRTSSSSVRQWWNHKGGEWSNQEKALYDSSKGKDEVIDWNSSTSIRTHSVTNSILNNAIMHMRQNTVSVVVENLEPNTDNINALFDGVQVALSEKESKYKGTTSGTLRSDASGRAEGTFRIPANVPCGTKELKVFPASTPSLVGVANYTANGRSVTINKNIWREFVRPKPVDPLAQSFMFELDQFITGVGLYFKDKDSVEPITVQVRAMINGYPSATCLSEVVVQPNRVVVSSDGSSETVVKFDNPVYCKAGEQYCFTILSNSTVDSVYIAETTKQDITSGVQVSKNPYLAGNLFSSSNAITWTAHQSSDLKFKIYGTKFEQKGTCTFKKIAGVSFDRIMIASEESIPAGCNVSWKYSVNGGAFLPIEAYDDRDLLEIAENVVVKVDFTSNQFASPAIALDSLILSGFENKNNGVYISRNVEVPDGYNKVKQVLELDLPSNTNITMSYSTDATGNSWKSVSNTSTGQSTQSGFKTYVFEASVGSTAKNYRCKVELTTVDKKSRPRVKKLRSIMKTV